MKITEDTVNNFSRRGIPVIWTVLCKEYLKATLRIRYTAEAGNEFG